MQDRTQEGNEAYVILHRGARSRGYKRRARERGRERERERPCCQRVCVSTCPCAHLHVHLPRKALDITFYRCKEMSSCTTGCSYALHGWRGSALSPVHELMWPSGKCLEPCRSTVVGVAWILLTLSCFRRGLRAIRRHGCTWGAIITCYRSNLRWDTGLVPS
jgi:ferredoxin-like protein FixX